VHVVLPRSDSQVYEDTCAIFLHIFALCFSLEEKANIRVIRNAMHLLCRAVVPELGN
jgi:hypothetical protein